MWYWSVLTSGYSLPIAAKRSSQNGIEWMMPFDLVAELTCFLRLRASSKAKRMTRSQPVLVKIDCCMAISMSVPAKSLPPISEYSPSLFSRTT